MKRFYIFYLVLFSSLPVLIFSKAYGQQTVTFTVKAHVSIINDPSPNEILVQDSVVIEIKKDIIIENSETINYGIVKGGLGMIQGVVIDTLEIVRMPHVGFLPRFIHN